MAAKTTNISIRMDVELKARAEELFAALGMNISTAFNIFVRQALREGKIPFEISLTPTPQPETSEESVPKDPSAQTAEPQTAPLAPSAKTAQPAAPTKRKFPSVFTPPPTGQEAQTLPEEQKNAPRPGGAAQNIIDMF
ncbi:MAG: type II toxin-antitoxin system RelB/DinJ family antitoxin [Thermoguttaceae bacterium]|nr:type II toxin-antitoxin system RelB/DinJ family antitoxin [Thermoguttaceae bacterium]